MKTKKESLALLFELGMEYYTDRHVSIIENFIASGEKNCTKLLDQLGSWNQDDLIIARGWFAGLKPNCSKHSIPDYLSDLKKVASDLADMPYDAVAEFFKHFEKKLIIDTGNDRAGGRVATMLSAASMKAEEMEEVFEKAAKICKPYMNSKKLKS